MSSERAWIVVLVATTFLAGLAGGVLFGFRLRPEGEHGPFAPYRSRLVRAYGLGDEAEGRLRQILDKYDEDVEALKGRYVRELEPEFVDVGEQCLQRIRRFVIPPGRREEFDRLTRAAALTAPSPQ